MNEKGALLKDTDNHLTDQLGDMKAMSQDGGKTYQLYNLADDLGHEVMGFLGGAPRGITPNLTKLAGQGMSFQKAHVNIAICAPSRSIIATGRYGHNSRRIARGSRSPTSSFCPLRGRPFSPSRHP